MSLHSPAFALLELDATCTEYDNRLPLPLDPVAGTADMEELPAGAKADVRGMCATLGCTPRPDDNIPLHVELSDHCPILVEFIDRISTEMAA